MESERTWLIRALGEIEKSVEALKEDECLWSACSAVEEGFSGVRTALQDIIDQLERSMPSVPIDYETFTPNGDGRDTQIIRHEMGG